VGYLVRKIKELGIYDDTVLIFHSDHGHYIGEHNRAGKTNINEKDPRGHWPLYDEVSHVPLLFRAPGAMHGTRRRELVQAVDIVPTVLELAGLTREVPFHGHSLVPLLHGEEVDWPRRVAVSTQGLSTNPDEGSCWTTLTDQEHTFLLGGSPEDSPQMYDRANDPGEEKNIFEGNKHKAGEMAKELLALLESVGCEAARIETLKTRLRKAGVSVG
jgi:arylsulfatase A-like enzyme